MFHFDAPLAPDKLAGVINALHASLSPRMQACCEAVAYIARRPDLVPVGMCVGPFTLMTKLIVDPIVPIFLMGTECDVLYVPLADARIRAKVDAFIKVNQD